jgi:hypothetical protein
MSDPKAEAKGAAEMEPVEAKVIEKKYTHLHRMVSTLADEAAVAGSSDFDIDGFMEGILAGETDEEVFGAQELSSLASKDYLLAPFYLKEEGIKWMRSTVTNGFPFYALLTVVDQETGEEVAVNGGGMSFVSVLYRLQELNYFNPEEYPDGRLLQFVGKDTSAGYTVVLLKPVAPIKRATARAAKG